MAKEKYGECKGLLGDLKDLISGASYSLFKKKVVTDCASKSSDNTSGCASACRAECNTMCTTSSCATACNTMCDTTCSGSMTMPGSPPPPSCADKLEAKHNEQNEHMLAAYDLINKAIS